MSTVTERAAFAAAFLAAVAWTRTRAWLRALRPSRRGCAECARWKSALADARRPLPAADQAPDEPALSQEEQAERAGEREELAELLRWRAGVSPGKRECGDRLADSLRLGLPDLADEDIARVLLRVGRYANDVAEEQDGNPYDCWVVLMDSLAVAAPDLAALELELAEGHGR